MSTSNFGHTPPETDALADLIREGRTVVIGAVRQEILSGIREPEQFERLKIALSFFPDEKLDSSDYVAAAKVSNDCLSSGYLMGNTDSLICAVAIRRNYTILSTDKDFEYASSVVPLKMYKKS